MRYLEKFSHPYGKSETIAQGIFVLIHLGEVAVGEKSLQKRLMLGIFYFKSIYREKG